MIIDLVRHGETDWNSEGRLQGGIDIPLNKVGIQQAEAIAQRLKNEKYDTIYTSELSRAQDTMYKIQEFHPSSEVIIHSLLNERSFGDFEGEISSEMDWEMLPGEMIYKTPPNGESMYDHAVRTKKFLDTLEDSEKHILIVCHGGVIRSIIHLISGEAPEKIKPVNTAYYRLEKQGNTYKILINNSGDHLPESLSSKSVKF